MKSTRRVAVVEEFYNILEQVHTTQQGLLHAGAKKTFAKVQALYSHIPRSVLEHYVKLCEACSLYTNSSEKPSTFETYCGQWVLFSGSDAINAQVHSSTKFTPIEFVFGQPPRSIVIPDIENRGKIDEDDLKLDDSAEKEDTESAPEICDTKTSALHDRSDCVNGAALLVLSNDDEMKPAESVEN
ncbi:hypothetical protein EMCRGX_G012182 [Ephydatia muelleri]